RTADYLPRVASSTSSPSPARGASLQTPGRGELGGEVTAPRTYEGRAEGAPGRVLVDQRDGAPGVAQGADGLTGGERAARELLMGVCGDVEGAQFGERAVAAPAWGVGGGVGLLSGVAGGAAGEREGHGVSLRGRR